MKYDSKVVDILVKKLNAKELQLYLYLFSKRDYRTNIVYTSYQIMMKDVGISNKTLIKTLKGLEEKDCLDIIPKQINGMSTSYSYRLRVDLEYREYKSWETPMDSVYHHHTTPEERRK